MYVTNRLLLSCLISAILQHSAFGMQQSNVAQPEPANGSFVMSVEPQPTSAQEPLSVMQAAHSLEVRHHSHAAKAHGHHAARGTRNSIERLRAEVPRDESIGAKKAKAMLVATSAEAMVASSFRAAHRARSDTESIVGLSLVIFALLTGIAMLHRLDDKVRTIQSALQSTSTGLAEGSHTSPWMPTAKFQATQSMSKTNSARRPVADMRLVLPTPLVAPRGEGALFRIDDVWTPWFGGYQAKIHNLSTKEEVACLHWTETRYGSGVLFVLSPNSPLAWLNTNQLRSGQVQDVSVFPAADEYWSAMAAPAAIVKPTSDDSAFVMLTGGQELLTIHMNDKKRLSSITKDEKVIAQFQDGFGPGFVLYVVGGTDAGLVLLATSVCCLRMIEHPKKAVPSVPL